MAGSSLRGLERSPGMSQELPFLFVSISSHPIALLLNVLKFMRHFQDAPSERIDVFEVFAYRNFPLNVAYNADRSS
jgi:hypothetical protein